MAFISKSIPLCSFLTASASFFYYCTSYRKQRISEVGCVRAPHQVKGLVSDAFCSFEQAEKLFMKAGKQQSFIPFGPPSMAVAANRSAHLGPYKNTNRTAPCVCIAISLQLHFRVVVKHFKSLKRKVKLSWQFCFANYEIFSSRCIKNEILHL